MTCFLIYEGGILVNKVILIKLLTYPTCMKILKFGGTGPNSFNLVQTLWLEMQQVKLCVLNCDMAKSHGVNYPKTNYIYIYTWGRTGKIHAKRGKEELFFTKPWFRPVGLAKWTE